MVLSVIKSVTFLFLLSSCTNNSQKFKFENVSQAQDSISVRIDSVKESGEMPKAATLINYAKTLEGVPYKYASADPALGFDCSGFITHVFNHFNMEVPRSSVDFTNYGKGVSLKEAKPGDLILFTGTDSSIRTVGHMGIVTQIQDTLEFIHATSGKAYAVTITPLNKYYQGRFVKVIRVLN